MVGLEPGTLICALIRSLIIFELGRFFCAENTDRSDVTITAKADETLFITRVVVVIKNVFYLRFKFTFLVLFDYVSRAHEIEIRPPSVRRPSFCGIDYLFIYCTDAF